MKTSKIAILSCCFLTTSFLYSQAIEGTLNWYNGEGTGMFTEKAYKKLKKKDSKTVVVAVIDSGVDIEHEDLQGKIWTNEGEIPNNGIDDDGNGYIDDVHGWNFLGNTDGTNMNDARLEKARIYHNLAPKFENINASELEDLTEFNLFQKVKEELENDRAQFEPYLQMAKDGILGEEYSKYILDQMNYNLNPDFDDRSIVGDDPNDINDRNYGNGDVEGPDALHGTHVAGIIGAIRGNDKGGDGVAENIKIMSIRAVPNGDEWDKDIALAIRYAVDNGAKVINMSFGKAYSPNGEWVYEAMAYADKNDVLLVHAAGNDRKNIDDEPNFPTEFYEFQSEELINILTVGASTRDQENLVASFSNYGTKEVDVFAPGFEIYNSVPQSEYMNLQGTSMASPMVAGVAAMLKSYYFDLTMSDIKNAIVSSVVVQKQLEDQCNSKGIVNVYNALKECDKMLKNK